MKRGGKGNWKPWYGRGGSSSVQKQKDKPLFAVDRPSGSSLSFAGELDNRKSENNPTDKSFSTEREPGSFIGWKLYFPDKEFKNSNEIIQRVKIMEKHFETYLHWYDTTEVEHRCVLNFKLKNLLEDEVFAEYWPDFFDDLKHNATTTLACIALAMHNIIVKSHDKEEHEIFQHKKIYTRPLGFEPQSRLSQACQTHGELVSLTGTVVRVEPVKTNCKTACFRCSVCSAELVVKRNHRGLQYTHPSSCQRGCPARGNFIELLSSPYTIYQPQQMIRLQESTFAENQEFKTLDVKLIQNLVCSVVPGQVITVCGILKHENDKSNKFMSSSKFLKYYLKCFSVEMLSKFTCPKRELMTDANSEFISMMKAEPSPFRTLVHSLSPTIFGREEVKAGLILCLLSGSDLLTTRRSESHILLVGNPGSGKSKLLQSCADVSSKRVFVSGPTLTAVGLTASVGKNGTVDAGALIMANGGCCCIDEFDKMPSHSHVLLESMEQQVISISKCGIKMNAPSKVVVIAAANPVSSFYDNSKTILENVKISTPLLSRFDLIFTLADQTKTSDQQFLNHVSQRHNRNQSSGNPSFFETSNSSSVAQMRQENAGLRWLHMSFGEQSDPLSIELLQLYIGYAREKIKPELSLEAAEELKNFFTSLRQLTVGQDVQPITFRQLEALKRLTLARARADLAEVASREHAIDVINIFKFTMVDVFASDDPNDTIMSSLTIKKPKVQNVSSMSKPKQVKAFLEHLQNEVDEQGRQTFTTAEMKSMAKELGIREYDEIIFRLNTEGYILKKVDGYQVV